MPEFIVTIREVHAQDVAVEASSPEEAKVLVSKGKGVYVRNTLEFIETMDNVDVWEVEEVVEVVE